MIAKAATLMARRSGTACNSRRTTYRPNATLPLISPRLLLQPPIGDVPGEVAPRVGLPALDAVHARVDPCAVVHPDDHVRVVEQLHHRVVGGLALLEVEGGPGFIDGLIRVGTLETRVVLSRAIRLRRDALAAVARCDRRVWIDAWGRGVHDEVERAELSRVLARARPGEQDARWLVLDLDLDAHGLPLVHEHLLHALTKLVAGRGRVCERQPHAVLGADAIRTLDPRGGLEGRARLRGVVSLLRAGVLRPALRDRRGSGFRLAEQELVDDLLLGRRVQEGPAYRAVSEDGVRAVRVRVLPVLRGVDLD